MTAGVGNAAFVAIIAIVPLVVLMLTSFVKISVVLSLLRNALGAPDAPSGLVVMGLSLILTFFVMMPVAIEMAHAAARPDGTLTKPAPGAPSTPGGAAAPSGGVAAPSGGVAEPSGGVAAPSGGVAAAPGGVAPAVDVTAAIRDLVPAQYQPQVDAAARAVEPLRGFLEKHAGARDRETFVGLATRMGRAVRGDELWVLAPAFVTSELREAFAIAVLIFVPFLVIDLIVGLALAALGLASTSPQAIALPLKLLLFVAVDGWRLLIDALLRGYV